jgi:hypothetical protein
VKKLVATAKKKLAAAGRKVKKPAPKKAKTKARKPAPKKKAAKAKAKKRR